MVYYMTPFFRLLFNFELYLEPNNGRMLKNSIFSEKWLALKGEEGAI